MRHNGSAILLAVIVFAVLVFEVSAYAVTSDRLTVAMRILAVSIGVAVIFAYAPVAWQAFKPAHKRIPPGRLLDSGDLLGVGVIFKWVGTIGLSLWNMTNILAGYPAWMRDHDMNAFFIGLLAMGGAFHLAALGAINGKIPRRSKVLIGLGIATALVAILAVGAYEGVFPRFAAWLEPAMTRPWVRNIPAIPWW